MDGDCTQNSNSSFSVDGVTKKQMISKHFSVNFRTTDLHSKSTTMKSLNKSLNKSLRGKSVKLRLVS